MNVYFRVDASLDIGTGHVMRCLTLAEALRQRGVKSAFVSRELSGHILETIASQGYEVYRLRAPALTAAGGSLYARWLGVSVAEDAVETLHILREKPIDWIITDHYALDTEWEQAARTVTRARLMVIDDLANRHHDCALLLDQNLHANLKTRYRPWVAAETRLLLGPSFALVRPAFEHQRQKMRLRSGEVKSILIFMGGTDPENHTARVLEALRILGRTDIQVNVVLGGTNPHITALQAHWTASFIRWHVQTSAMPQLMADSDLAIGGGGTASWERCCLGLPTIILSIAENQESIAAELDHQQLAVYAGRAQDLDSAQLAKILQDLLLEPTRLRQMSERATACVDGRGAVRVAEVLCAS